MPDASEPVSPWWRCTGYEILDGRIVPTRDSNVERYDPWRVFQNCLEHAKIGEPFLSLLNLLKELRNRRPTARVLSEDLTAKEMELITTWCTKNGLLHHRALAIWREPFDKRDGSYSTIDAVAWRRGGRWVTRSFDPTEMQVKVPRTSAVAGQAFLEHRLGGPLKPLRLESLRDLYFPRLRDSGRTTMPLPGDKDLWVEYSEPVSMFLEAIEDLARAVEVPSKNPDSANATMVDLLAGVCPTGIRREGAVFSLEWSSPSLLGSFATMALICHDRRQPPARCVAGGCFRWFVGPPNRRYCTARCQNNAEKSRSRARKTTAPPRSGSPSRRPR